MKKRSWILSVATICVAFILMLTGCRGNEKELTDNLSGSKRENITITNVSYDPTREFYVAYNEIFSDYYKLKTGIDVEVVQSHGGSGSQARSVVEGADADVVTLALEHDISLVEQAGLVESGWLDEFDKDSSPYTSTIVFLVRSGNIKGVHDWDDLIKEGIGIISPDPKSSGAACWNFLAAWYYAGEMYGNDENQMKEFMTQLYGNVLVMDSGARASTTTFVENGQGDVLVSWENEAIATVAEHPGEYEIVSPSISILAQPSVAIVDENANKNGTQKIAYDYLAYLYSDEAQMLIGEYGYRPSNEEILKKYADKFNLDMKLCTIEDFGGWDAAYDKFFVDGGIFDEIYVR